MGSIAETARSARQQLRRRSRVVAGLVDVAAASLAAYAVGVYAVRSLSTAELGAYALTLSAVFLAGSFSHQLVFVPTMAESIKTDAAARYGYYRTGLRKGAVPVMGAAFATLAVWLVLPGDLTTSQAAGLAISGSLAALLQPIQLFGRQLLHYASRSWKAALISVARLVSVLVALVVLTALGVGATAIPLGALAVGNFVAAGIASYRTPESQTIEIKAIYRRGRPLVAATMLPVGAGFLSSLIIISVAGAESLGAAEAARVVAQPVGVAAAGVAAVTDPRIMEAVTTRNPAKLRLARNAFLALVTISALLYGLVVIPIWAGNVMYRLVPVAYEIPGLVSLSLLAVLFWSLGMPFVAQIIASNREASILKAEIPASILQLGAALTAGYTRAFARPLGLAAHGLSRTVLLISASTKKGGH